MPKLWEGTIDAHHLAVRAAILDTTAALVSEHGPLSVTMSQIAHETGIGRATLYKYFPDVESILVAWHERRIAGHLTHLSQVDGNDDGQRLEAVLTMHAMMTFEHRDSAIAVIVHGDDSKGRQNAFLREAIAEAIEADAIREDMTPEELATYCLHALGAAADLPSKAAVERLVHLTLDGLRPPGE
ncbi:MAG: transcriptional regulator, TetR family [Aeromicrobium sp.]|nr:transcriptional regulator, TetR family [Aeromicrobium sp.]